ncbi:hypothetical protein [Streptomyces sp. NPDC001933]|uniref:hypothetical protein n=1 Tax=Streptomyces sp. NPDC001933 TaxID=3364626 RepID=UPI003696B587
MEPDEGGGAADGVLDQGPVDGPAAEGVVVQAPGDDPALGPCANRRKNSGTAIAASIRPGRADAAFELALGAFIGHARALLDAKEA